MSAMKLTLSAGRSARAEATCAPAGRDLWLCHQPAATQAVTTQPASTRRQRRSSVSTPASGQAGRGRARLAQQVRERHDAFGLLAQQSQQIVRGARLAEQSPLPEVAVVGAQELQLALRLDAFRDDLHPEAAAHLDDG